jgi:hypothetical protein
MFEEVTEDKVTSGSKTGLIVALFAAIIIGGGIYYYTITNRPAQGPAKAQVPAAEAITPPDPAKDLRVLSATMTKDKLGTATMWNVTIENKSRVYTYSAIEYQTLYFGADNKPLLINSGKIAASIDPGEQNKSEIREALFPSGTSVYQFRITNAKSSTQ